MTPARYIRHLMAGSLAPAQVPEELRAYVVFSAGETLGRLWARNCTLRGSQWLYQLQDDVDRAIAQEPEPIRDGFALGAQAGLLQRLRRLDRGGSRTHRNQ